MIRAWKAALAATVLTFGAGAPMAADAQIWTLGSWHQFAANRRYYSVQAITGDTNGWLIANAQAMALTGPTGGGVTLAAITSSALDAFIFAGIDDPTYWSVDSAGNDEGPNIGGYQTDQQAEPAGRFAWTNGDPWSYTQWAAGEPNNSAGTENYVTLFCNTGTGCRSGNWNDISGATSPVGTQGSVHYYIAESIDAVAGVPEPATWAMLLMGFGLVGASLRSRRAGETAPA